MKKYVFVIVFVCSTILGFSQGTVTETEAIEKATELQASVKNDDPSVLTSLIDYDSFLKKIKANSTEAQKAPAMFDGFKSSFSVRSFASQIVEALQSGSYEFVRTYEVNNKRHLLFRAFGKNGLNYHDYSLVKTGNQVKVDDIFVYITGENLSETLGNFLDESIAGYDAGDGSMPDNLKAVLKMKELKKKGDYPSIIKLYEGLDATDQKSKVLQIMYISACQKQGALSDKYKNALENYAKSFPEATNTYLLMLDVYFLNQQYDKALNAVNVLDSLLGRDPFLNYYRASILLVSGDKANAKLYSDSIFAYKPLLPAVLKNVVILHMDDNEVQPAKDAIAKYKQTEGFKQEQLDDIYLMYPELKDKDQ